MRPAEDACIPTTPGSGDGPMDIALASREHQDMTTIPDEVSR
jgi:hypothetical protein